MINEIRRDVETGNHCMAEKSEGQMRYLLGLVDRMGKLLEKELIFLAVHGRSVKEIHDLLKEIGR